MYVFKVLQFHYSHLYLFGNVAACPGLIRGYYGPAIGQSMDKPYRKVGLLAKIARCSIIFLVCGLSSAVECLLAKEKVKGSNPLARFVLAT